MARHLCPACGFTFTSTANKKASSPQLTKEVNGRTLCGKMVNYTTGPRMSWYSFPVADDSKRRARLSRKYGTAERNAALHYTGAQWLERYVMRAYAYKAALQKKLAKLY